MVHPAFATARSLELFQQGLTILYDIPPLRNLLVGQDHPEMNGTAIRLLRQRIRRHFRKAMHIA